MDELFDVHFTEDRKSYTYKLAFEQAALMYQSIGQFLATTEGATGFDVVFTEQSPISGEDVSQVFKLDPSETFNLYRQLGTYLQSRYPGSESLIGLREANS